MVTSSCASSPLVGASDGAMAHDMKDITIDLSRPLRLEKESSGGGGARSCPFSGQTNSVGQGSVGVTGISLCPMSGHNSQEQHHTGHSVAEFMQAQASQLQTDSHDSDAPRHLRSDVAGTLACDTQSGVMAEDYMQVTLLNTFLSTTSFPSVQTIKTTQRLCKQEEPNACNIYLLHAW